MSLTQLPLEILSLIVAYVPLRDLLRLGLVNKRLRNLFGVYYLPKRHAHLRLPVNWSTYELFGWWQQWKKGRPAELAGTFRSKYMPRLAASETRLMLATGTCIYWQEKSLLRGGKWKMLELNQEISALSCTEDGIYYGNLYGLAGWRSWAEMKGEETTLNQKSNFRTSPSSPRGLMAHTTPLTGLAVLSKGKYLSVGYDGMVRFHEAYKPDLLMYAHTQKLWDISAVKADTIMIAASLPDSLALLKFTPTGMTRIVSPDIDAMMSSVYALARVNGPLWMSDEVFLSGSYDGNCRVWDTRSDRAMVGKMEDRWSDEAIYSLSWDGWNVCAGLARYGRIMVWDLRRMGADESGCLERVRKKQPLLRITPQQRVGRRTVESPVYKIHSDLREIWAVTENSLWHVDFSSSSFTTTTTTTTTATATAPTNNTRISEN